MAAKFSIESIFSGKDKGTIGLVTRIGAKVGKVTRTIRGNIERINDKLKKVGGSARGALGIGGLAGAAFVAQRAMRAVITTGADFEQTLVGAGARFNLNIRKGTVAFKELEDAARRIGKTTEFTSSEAAGALDFLAKAGLNTTQALKLLPGIVDLATATNLDLARSADIVTDSINAFGLASDDAAQLQKNFTVLSDQMAKATLVSNQNFEELFETVKKGVPAARAAGASVLELLASTAAFSSAGLKASDAGTAMKNIFLKLASIDVQEDLLEGFGLDVLDEKTRDLRPFADIMDDLVSVTSDLSKTQRAGLIADVFGLRGVTGVVNVLAAGVPKFREFEKRIANSTNLTRDLAAIMRDTSKNEMRELASAAESVQISFFKANQGGLKVFVTGMTDVLRAIDDVVKAEPEWLRSVNLVTALGAAALTAGLVFGGLASAIGFIIASPAALTAAIAALVAGLTVAAGAQAGANPVPGMGSAFNSLVRERNEPVERRDKLMGPQDRFGRALDRLGNMSLAELRIIAPPGSAELIGDGGPHFSLTFDEREDF